MSTKNVHLCHTEFLVSAPIVDSINAYHLTNCNVGTKNQLKPNSPSPLKRWNMFVVKDTTVRYINYNLITIVCMYCITYSHGYYFLIRYVEQLGLFLASIDKKRCHQLRGQNHGCCSNLGRFQRRRWIHKFER